MALVRKGWEWEGCGVCCDDYSLVGLMFSCVGKMVDGGFFFLLVNGGCTNTLDGKNCF